MMRGRLDLFVFRSHWVDAGRCCSEDMWLDEKDIDPQLVATYNQKLQVDISRQTVNTQQNAMVRKQVSSLMVQLNMTIQAVAKSASLGCSKGFLDMWLNGDTDMSTYQLESLSNYCSQLHLWVRCVFLLIIGIWSSISCRLLCRVQILHGVPMRG